jgi:hypothetical protein
MFFFACFGWDMGFSPQALHTSMLKHQSCACETIQHLFFSPQESNGQQ